MTNVVDLSLHVLLCLDGYLFSQAISKRVRIPLIGGVQANRRRVRVPLITDRKIQSLSVTKAQRHATLLSPNPVA